MRFLPYLKKQFIKFDLSYSYLSLTENKEMNEATIWLVVEDDHIKEKARQVVDGIRSEQNHWSVLRLEILTSTDFKTHYKENSFYWQR